MADHPEYTSLANGHRFNAGQMPVMQGLEDFYHFAEDDPERMADLVVDIVASPSRSRTC